jgi:HlyD family secretion protein
VDAFPNRVFHGTVNKIRLNATMTQNVVTYTVVVNTDNSDGRLLPYLTANVNFLAGKATNALLVLNSALRWHPRSDLIAPESRQSGAGPSGTGRPGGNAAAGESGGHDLALMQSGTLWAADGNYVRPVSVKLGLTDGTWTEVQGDGLSTNMLVVTGILSAEAAAEETPGANPFVPEGGGKK